MRSFASVLVLTVVSIASIGCESGTSTTPETGAAAADPSAKGAGAVPRTPGTKTGQAKPMPPPKSRKDL
jgi:hypothetical protein